MMKTRNTNSVLLFFLLMLFLFITSKNSYSQSCGFGCLGLSGVYGGFTIQDFKADGINDWIKSYSTTGANFEFNKGEGFRIGTNLFRARFDGYFITAKGFFQFINEEYTTSSDLTSTLSESYKLKHNYWGVALDFGVPLFSIIDLKIIEGGVNFYNVELKSNRFVNNIQTTENKIENTKLDIGYYVGSGILIHIVPDYISIEGTASYNFYKINEFMDDNGDAVQIQQGDNFVENKGISATVQLNLGFPL
ncbi:MAG: hypothetical protein KJ571_12315 [Bacteroidetes bacterium]|nr:hypothetical protein [Bacteroidota bacterium]